MFGLEAVSREGGAHLAGSRCRGNPRRVVKGFEPVDNIIIRAVCTCACALLCAQIAPSHGRACARLFAEAVALSVPGVVVLAEAVVANLEAHVYVPPRAHEV